MDTQTAWNDLVAHMHEVDLLESIDGVLGWDQQTMMPPQGAALRGSQSALVARLAHERLVDPRVGDWLAALELGDLDEVQRASVRNIRREHARATRIPGDLVERLARARADGFDTWLAAKASSDFSRFAPQLRVLLELTREYVAAIDADRHPYDVLLDIFDPGSTVAELEPMFARLRDGLQELLDAVASRPQLEPIADRFDLATQRALHEELIVALGYDLESGRLDPAEHPFSIGLGRGDVRITTHLYEDDLLNGLGSTIHETGHALYEQGLPHDWPGTRVNRAASFGMHESQSRFWENFVGRSLPFFRWFEHRLGERFGAVAPSATELYRAANRVERGLIRVAADEVTYNLHIVARFELEVALLEGRLAVDDLPEAWNARYEEYLGVRPPDDARGVLQDVHWSSGAFGYFPSYTLGNLYAASLGRVLEEERPTLWDEIEHGHFGEVLAWLRTKVHGRGHLDDAPDLVRKVVGERDQVDDLLTHLWSRHGALYGLSRA